MTIWEKWVVGGDNDNDSTLRNGRIVDNKQIGGDKEDTGDVAHLKKILFHLGEDCG